jgi:hypothetical protein
LRAPPTTTTCTSPAAQPLPAESEIGEEFLAANRVMGWDYPDDMSMGEKLDHFVADAQLAAGALIERAARESADKPADT